MKSVEIEAEIRDNPALASEVDRATRLLKAELGPSAGLVTARWSQPQGDRGRVVLEISDWTGSAEDSFGREELATSPRLADRLHRLWGDLLQVRSHKQMERVKQLVQELEED